MAPRGGATIRMRRLGRALAAHRQAAGLTQLYAAQRLGWSEAKIVRLEGARATRPSLKDIEAALTLYDVVGNERAAVIDLARTARERGWWYAYRDLLLDQEAYLAFEDAATSICAFHLGVVPGLLQSPQYAAALVGEGERSGEVPPGAATRRIAIRMTRSLVLERPVPPRYEAILTEGAIRQQVGGPEVMREQIDRIIALAERPTIDVRLLPFDAGPYIGMAGPFVVFDYADPADHPIVCLETSSGHLYLEDEHLVDSYRRAVERMRAQAHGHAETVDALAAIRDARS